MPQYGFVTYGAGDYTPGPQPGGLPQGLWSGRVIELCEKLRFDGVPGRHSCTMNQAGPIQSHFANAWIRDRQVAPR